MPNARSNLLIDTDPGVDDALAIMMAHRHARICGLSVVAGNVGLAHTTANALKLLDVIDCDAPVFAGCATPLIHAAADAGFVHGLDGFGDVGYFASARIAESRHASIALAELAAAQAHKPILVALAPLTNLALAVKLDPTLPSRFARLVVMGGAVNGRGNMDLIPAEFNIGFDPEAAHVVFSAWPEFDLVDWEACVRHAIAFPVFDRLVAADTAPARFYRAISRKARVFNERHERAGMITADALAMAVALEPAIVRSAQTRPVAIDLTGNHTRGATMVDWDSRSGRAANARIVLEVDQARFEALIASALGVDIGVDCR